MRIKLDGEDSGNLDENVFLEFGFITEFSEAVSKSRSGIRFEWNKAAFDFLVETEDWKDVRFTDVRIGGGVTYQGISAIGLHSIKQKDYRLEIGIDIVSFLNGRDY